MDTPQEAGLVMEQAEVLEERVTEEEGDSYTDRLLIMNEIEKRGEAGLWIMFLFPRNKNILVTTMLFIRCV